MLEGQLDKVGAVEPPAESLPPNIMKSSGSSRVEESARQPHELYQVQEFSGIDPARHKKKTQKQIINDEKPWLDSTLPPFDH